MPCSRLSMPSATASLKLTEHRWPVTLIPRLCASAMAAPSSARRMSAYALIQVAPSEAQYATNRLAASGELSTAMLPPPCGPVMYGAVK